MAFLIQLEKFYITGSSWKPILLRLLVTSYGDELARCQRYFQGWNATSSTERAKIDFVYDDDETVVQTNQQYLELDLLRMLTMPE